MKLRTRNQSYIRGSDYFGDYSEYTPATSELQGEFERIEEWDHGAETSVRHYKVLNRISGFTSGYTRDVRSNIWYIGAPPPIRFEDLRLIDDLASKELWNMAMGDVNGTNFELLPFAAELDDTFAMFSASFFKSLFSRDGYGAYTWGIAPLVSDLKKLVGAVQAQMKQTQTALERYNAPVRRRRYFEYLRPRSSVPYGPDPLKVSGFLNVQGKREFLFPAYADNIADALSLLDNLGVHPDLKTKWDLIPLSFVVDYFFPVGDLLESLHPRGWAQRFVTFKGTRTVNVNITASESLWDSEFVGGPAYDRSFHLEGSASYYTRYHGYFSQDVKLPEWKAPSFKELFNTFYLSRK